MSIDAVSLLTYFPDFDCHSAEQVSGVQGRRWKFVARGRRGSKPRLWDLEEGSPPVGSRGKATVRAPRR